MKHYFKCKSKDKWSVWERNPDGVQRVCECENQQWADRIVNALNQMEIEG